MRFLDYFSDEQNATVVIKGKVNSGSYESDGTPVYTTTERFNGKGWFWLASANERYAFSRLGNESTHWLALPPNEVTNTITESDIATVNGNDYRMYIGEDILGLTDVEIYTVKRVD